MIGLPNTHETLPDTDYILSMSFDPCQISSALRYEFSKAPDGSPHRKAVYGRKAGCYCFEPGDKLLVQVYALCSRDPSTRSLPDITIESLVMKLHGKAVNLPVALHYSGDFYIMFASTDLYTFAAEPCQWPLTATLSVEINGECKTYSFDPEVIVGDGETD